LFLIIIVVFSGLAAWLDEVEHQISMLNVPGLQYDQIAVQQDVSQRLTQSINQHKPLLDKLNKTGEALAALVLDEDAAKIHDILKTNNGRYRYAALRAELCEHQQTLEQALQESSKFSDKLEGMLRDLTNIADQLNHVESISAYPPEICNDALCGFK
jgi:dystonin